MGLNSGKPEARPPVSLSEAVFDKCGFAEVDVQFADVFYVIADAFEVFGDEEEMRL